MKMVVESRIKLIVDLGIALRDVVENQFQPVFDPNHTVGKAKNDFCERCSQASLKNPWFTPDNVNYAVSSWASALNQDEAEKWLQPYAEKLGTAHPDKTVGIVMAGNIPLVGLHDLLCVIVSAQKVLARLSSDDLELMTGIVNLLTALDPAVGHSITLTESRLQGFDAIIATGSNNTSRYFEYYFGKYPNIIRKNRNSIAVLDGNETAEEIENLGRDIFTYHGLGCRNVSRILVPEKFNFHHLLDNLESFNPIIHHHKYCNNYDYQKSIMMINRIPFLDNGFLLLKESNSTISPVSVIHYSYYRSEDAARHEIAEIRDQLQCIVSHLDIADTVVPFGMAQSPKLWDYADGIDTVQFLLNLDN